MTPGADNSSAEESAETPTSPPEVDARTPDEDTPDELATEKSPANGKDGKAEATPWWDDERMPWKGKPSKADVWCWIGITAIGIFALVMLPLRPILLGYTPYVLVGLTGSRTGMVTIGALGATGDPWWPLGLVIGILSIIKFDLVYFLAGRLWGRGLIEVFTGDSPRARKNAARAERWALKWAVPAVAFTYVPIPMPAPVIYATVAMAGMSWRKFIIVNLISATVLQTGWLLLGWALGEPAVRVLDVYADYAMYLSLAIIAGMVIVAMWRSRKNDSQPAKP